MAGRTLLQHLAQSGRRCVSNSVCSSELTQPTQYARVLSRFSSSVADPEYATLSFPDGKEAKLPILTPTYGTDKFVAIGSLHKQAGVYTYDPGASCTASCSSSVTFLDGDKGECLYRGYPVQDLAEKSDFLEVSYLLLYGELPNKEERAKFEKEIRRSMVLNSNLIDFFKNFPTAAHPMAQMCSVVGALSAFYPFDLDPKNVDQHKKASIRLIAKMPMISALIYRTDHGLPVVYPREDFTYAENLLYMMFQNPTHTKFPHNEKVFKAAARAIDAFLILHADHEQNASTSTVRIAGSSQANPYACVSAGVASLWGPAHGGANEAVIKMLEEIGSKDNVAEFVRKVKNKEDGVRLMGFGHRVYKNYDPRARYFAGLVGQVLDEMDVKDPQLAVAQELERIALEDEYFIKRKLYPNVDFYTGIMLRALGVPTSMFTVFFALARTTGWTSQWKEMVEQSEYRIFRPRQIYQGYPERRM
mmetsp:Transcript_32023/g.38772  ORF Transcript_32023/g.38772 Transcript_32023/m.38772 type:complete len:474 (+) Transcript_32023:87-1508(+)|eukprot:CAMPEP_0197850400 /NCGR_PEP_ID=MMETSP1438-20131217/15294_1 /TAXON_ID=1461541 /ORGANISM="Pterosperma sp., Strain CCMP1384" /LENGTH=473 /DNA_ID=CAMNT_0043463553 /DNA_START=87 /DNA_END=1508 /DNA_ORIENTATION=+